MTKVAHEGRGGTEYQQINTAKDDIWTYNQFKSLPKIAPFSNLSELTQTNISLPLDGATSLTPTQIVRKIQQIVAISEHEINPTIAKDSIIFYLSDLILIKHFSSS